jgi:transposase
VRRYVEAAQGAGLCRSDGVEAVDDGLIGVVAEAVRPVRPDGHGAAWEQLTGFEEQITAWVAGDGEQRPLTITKIHTLLARQGCVVPYRTLIRFAGERCGFGRKDTTVRVADGDPGVECQIDFGYLGMLTDAEDGRRRKVYALIFTAVYSRHMFVWLSYSQTLAAVIAGCQAAWDFFGGVFAVLIPDNLTPVIAAADAVNPRFTQGWLDYAGHVGFLTDPARVRSPKDKPRVERAVQYVRRNFWDGETFTSLDQAQQAVTAWCARTAGTRIHGSGLRDRGRSHRVRRWHLRSNYRRRSSRTGGRSPPMDRDRRRACRRPVDRRVRGMGNAVAIRFATHARQRFRRGSGGPRLRRVRLVTAHIGGGSRLPRVAPRTAAQRSNRDRALHPS